jgi:hypothetical protein
LEYPRIIEVNCTSNKVFAAALYGNGEGKGQVLVIWIDYLFCDEMKGVTDLNALNFALESAIKSYLWGGGRGRCNKKRPDLIFHWFMLFAPK